MSAGPARRLRVAEATAGEAPASAPPLGLISALSAGRVDAVDLAGPADPAYRLRLPGIGGRYIAGIAAHAREHGFTSPETAALLDAVEARSAMWVVCPSAAALRRAGLGAGNRWRGRARLGAGRASRSMPPPWPPWRLRAVPVRSAPPPSRAPEHRSVWSPQCAATVSV